MENSIKIVAGELKFGTKVRINMFHLSATFKMFTSNCSRAKKMSNHQNLQERILSLEKSTYNEIKK